MWYSRRMNDDELTPEELVKKELQEALAQLDPEENIYPNEEAKILSEEDGLGHKPAEQSEESYK